MPQEHSTTKFSSFLQILMYITLVYHYIPCVACKEILIQVSPLHSCQLRLLNITALACALKSDPDLAEINPTTLLRVYQTLYVVSGCDYVSFFSQLGKATFLRYIYQYASFISSGKEYSGTLADTDLQDALDEGYLAFVRLIGTVYFKKYSTSFDGTSPTAHFQSFLQPTLTAQQQHFAWLEDIRQNIWFWTKFENETIPSN